MCIYIYESVSVCKERAPREDYVCGILKAGTVGTAR